MEDVISGTVFELFQYISLMFAVFTIYFVIKRSQRNNQWYWDIPILLLLGHIIVFYTYIVITRFTPLNSTAEFLTFWSATLRFHELGTLLIVSIVSYIRERKKWGKK